MAAVAARALQLHYVEDLRTLGLVATFFLLQVGRWRADDATVEALGLGLGWHAGNALWLFSLALFSFAGATITHNCIHVPMFRKLKFLPSLFGQGSCGPCSDALNAAWMVVLTHTYGHPVSSLVPGHNLSHHKHTQGAKDVMRTTKMRHRWHFANLFLFVLQIGLDIQKNDGSYFADQRRHGKPIYFQARLEAACLWPVHVLLAFWDWRRFLLCIFLPQFFGKWGIITVNLLQHDGCPEPDAPGGQYNFARNFTGSTLNWITCNNGFHTIHHMYPGWHWTRLPRAHAHLVKPHIHPNLDQPSILGYAFRTFFVPLRWGGGRRWFDGTPYELPPLVSDEPWYTGQKETFSGSLESMDEKEDGDK